MSEPRSADHPVDPLFTERWSPRAFDGTEIPQADLDTILEAARWAPSAFNYQPWRLLYAPRGTEAWNRFLTLLVPFNQEWAQHASVLLFILSDMLMGEANGDAPQSFRSHSFDAGAAWALLALQATRLGYHAHGMTGVDFDSARETLNIPERLHIDAAVAIGRRGDPSLLPGPLQERERPNGRKPIGEFAFEAALPGS